MRRRDNLTIPLHRALARLNSAAHDAYAHAELAHCVVKVVELVSVVLVTLLQESLEGLCKALHLSIDHCPHFQREYRRLERHRRRSRHRVLNLNLAGARLRSRSYCSMLITAITGRGDERLPRFCGSQSVDHKARPLQHRPPFLVDHRDHRRAQRRRRVTKTTAQQERCVEVRHQRERRIIIHLPQ